MKNLTLSVNNREWHRVNVLELSGQVRNQPDITRIPAQSTRCYSTGSR